VLAAAIVCVSFLRQNSLNTNYSLITPLPIILVLFFFAHNHEEGGSLEIMVIGRPY
jgi:hypothetical protein